MPAWSSAAGSARLGDERAVPTPSHLDDGRGPGRPSRRSRTRRRRDPRAARRRARSASSPCSARRARRAFPRRRRPSGPRRPSSDGSASPAGRDRARPPERAVRVPRNLSGATRTRIGRWYDSARTPDRHLPGTPQEGAAAAVDLGREELIGIAHAERERLGRTIQYAPPESWERTSVCAGWRNRDVVAHMAGAGHGRRAALRRATRRRSSTRSARLDDGELRGRRLQRVAGERTAGAPRPRGASRLGTGAPRRSSSSRACSRTEEWRTSASPGSLGDDRRPATWCSRGSSSGGSTARTSARAPGSGPQIQHWPIYLTNDLGDPDAAVGARAGRDRPAGRERPGRPRGRRRGVVALGPRAPARRRPPDKKPDAYIQGRGARIRARRRRVASPWTSSWTTGTSSSVETPTSRGGPRATSARTPDAPSRASAGEPRPVPVRTT